MLNVNIAPESSLNLHRVDRRSFEPSYLGHVLDIESGFGRAFLRNLSVTFFALIVCTLLGLIVANLVIILDRGEGIINNHNVALHFSASVGFLCAEVICFILVDRFFQTDPPERLDDKGRETERVYRAYLFVNICCLFSFLSYLVLVQQELYWQAYWSIFIGSIFNIYCHIRVSVYMQEVTESCLAQRRFENFSKYFSYIFGLTAFVGIVCLVIDTLALANQIPRSEEEDGGNY